MDGIFYVPSNVVIALVLTAFIMGINATVTVQAVYRMLQILKASL